MTKNTFFSQLVRNDGLNTLEFFSRSMFNDKESHLNIFLFSVEKESTVFSDVGFTSISEGAFLSYEFPLTNSHYIVYGFTGLDAFIKQIKTEKGMDLSNSTNLLKSTPKEVHVKKIMNDLPRLSSFNTRMIKQSRKFIFSKSTKPYVL